MYSIAQWIEVVTIKIYIEGGGEGKDLDIRFREAWTKFFHLRFWE